MSFQISYERWFAAHVAARTGERLRRLIEGHAYAEVYDFRDGVRYLDHAYLRPPYMIDVEVDGFSSHSRDVDRRTFADGLMRQNHLVLDGWIVLRFSYDDVKDRPRQCQQIIQQLLGKLYGGESKGGGIETLPLKQREIVRLAARSGNPITPLEVSACLGISRKHAGLTLRQLVTNGILFTASGNIRTRSYMFNPSSGYNPLLWK